MVARPRPSGDFINASGSVHSTTADLNASGVTTAQDLSAVLSAWFGALAAGC
ncbi:MAG TPA: hypothetical protein VD963_11345 [Phycisphaerales bacterium]|nr:hypothetical protein [Phycisphaerales bacterium]